MSQILTGLIPSFVICDVRELLCCLEDRDPSHHIAHRPTIDEIYSNYEINELSADAVRNKIILFDDVLTNGTHFCAARKKIIGALS